MRDHARKMSHSENFEILKAIAYNIQQGLLIK